MTTITIDLYGFPMECEYEYDEGAEPRFSPVYGGDPGWPPSASLLSCKVGGVNIYEMLDNQQVERIQRAIVDEVEFA